MCCIEGSESMLWWRGCQQYGSVVGVVVIDARGYCHFDDS